MAVQNDAVVEAFNRKANTIAAIKQYQHIKKVMADFSAQLSAQPDKSVRVDRKIN